MIYAIIVLACLALPSTSAFSLSPIQQSKLVSLQRHNPSLSNVLSTRSTLVVLKAADDDLNSLTLEEEVAQMVAEVKNKSERMSNLRNERGIEYAPWMNISPEDEAKIKGLMKEKAEARRKRELEQQNTRGSLLKDSTNQELSGTGLKYKIVDGNTVELEWATGSEKNTKGFIVKRRTVKTENFNVIASFETYGPLATKGIDGGVYRYLDEDLEVGKGYVYRITECESNGNENDLSQCLIELPTQEEQQGQVIALAAISILAVAAVASGFLLDPLQ